MAAYSSSIRKKLQRLQSFDYYVLLFFLLAFAGWLWEGLIYLVLERRWGLRWWDYSGYFLNINGRVCLFGALLFGFGGMLLNCYIQPWYMRAYSKIPPKRKLFLTAMLILLFVLDATYCAVSLHRGYGIAWR